MKLTFLGTGTSQGVPVIACRCGVCRSGDERDRRLRTSALLTTDEGKHILFDIGPDFRQQMLRQGVERLDAILVTHAHRDHVAGLDDVRSFNYVQHKSMDVYLNAIAKEALLRDYAYIFEHHEYPGLPEAELHEVKGVFRIGDSYPSTTALRRSPSPNIGEEPGNVTLRRSPSPNIGEEPGNVTGLEITPIKAMHKDLPILAFRVGKLAYITDANYIAPEEMEKLEGVEVLVINALRKEKHWSHFCLPEALEVIEKLGPGRAYLTHISHEMGLHAEVEKELPKGVFLAYDNLEVEI